MGDRKGFRAIKRQTLIGQLQKLLDQYSDGQIIKELIQNAEDGGAHKVKILFVNQHYEIDIQTWREDPVLFGLKGPALCVYNDGIFNEDDWNSIAAIQCSVKENEPLKVGKFGLGFKSVFHITDTPLIISGNSLMIMNPEADESDVVYSAELISLEKKYQASMNRLMCGIFGFTKEVLEKGFYNGSLFWFPLRQKSSKLSKKVYHGNEICNIFKCFTHLAPSYLLFLKEIEEIEMFEMDSSETKKLFQVGLYNQDMECLRKNRADFLKQIQSFNGQLAPRPISKSLVLNVRSEGFYWLKQNNTEDIWLVVNHYHGGQVSEELRTLIDDDDWNYSPYVSLGACLTRPISKGHVFCFLPLPEEGQSLTGFPVHVNGYFALSQDRHHVKWHSSEQLQSNRNTERSITWNTLLVREILPIVYSELLMQLVQPSEQMKICLRQSVLKTSISQSMIYGLFPNITNVTRHWKELVQPLYSKLKSTTCIFTRRNKGKWILPSDAIFIKNENMTIPMVKIIENILLQHDFNVAYTDNFITCALYEQHCPITFLSTKHIRNLLMSCNNLKISRQQKLCLLEYMLIENAPDLEGVQLLPLADGSFGTFNSFGTFVYITEKREDIEMFPQIGDHFVDFNVDVHVRVKMQNLCRSEKFQLKMFCPKHVPNLLRKCIEKNGWKNVAVTKQIDQWLVKVWTYIKRNQDLKKDVVDLHLLPEEDSTSGRKYLRKASNLSILSSHPGFQEMGKELQYALKKLNINVYSTLPESISSVVAGDLVEFPGIDGIFNCLKKINDEEDLLHDAVNTFNTNSDTEEKSELRNVFTQMKNLSEVINLLRSLHLFLSWTYEKYFSLEEVNEVYDPRGQPQIPITPLQEIVICNDNHTKTIVQKCGAKIISTEELCLSILLKLNKSECYSQSQRVTFMTFFKNNIRRFEKNENLIQLARNVRFVVDQNGQLNSPHGMLDPRSSILKCLFNDDVSLFPATQDTDYLRFLQNLGLRFEEDITDDDLMNCAQVIEENNSSLESCVEKANGFMMYLTKHEKRLQKNTFEVISTKRCCPVMDERPKGYPKSMKFKGDGNSWRLEKISSLLPVSCAKLVGGTAYIAKPNISTYLKQFQAKLIKMDYLVTSQLQMLADNYSPDEHDMYMSALQEIYKFLENSDQVKMTDLFHSKVIFTSDGTFQLPMNVWLLKRDTDISLEPYAYRLPEHLRIFKKLFHKMGCEYHQTTDILLNTLKAIKEFHENDLIHPREIVERDSKLVIAIVNTLADSKEDLSKKILLPVVCESDDILKLKPAHECAVCSDDWYNDVVSALDESDPFFIINKKISQDTALKFKVKYLTDIILENTKHFDMNYGQTEPLTTRISNIIKDYTDGFTIPKEIIQNADDAGASTVKFLYDERTVKNAQTCLFKDEMLPYQGPAFWAYNDKEFSAQDFENIIKLAGATKMDDKMKIGRFGLGFNSVYNLTDVPSFLSGDTYVVFDPHEEHLGKSGIKVELNHKSNRIIRQKMKGQFYPFEGIFGCRIVDEKRVKFKGTLFRLPLRSPEEAAKSKIKQSSYLRKDMVEFLNKIMQSAGSLLLFTQHVSTIELYYLERNAKAYEEPNLLMKVSKTSNRTGTSIINTLIESSNSEVLEKIYINLEIKHHDLCGLQSSKHQVSYTICWSYGKEAAKLTATQKDLKGLLPVAATALTQQSMKSLVGFYDTSHLFCFLPLPISTDLPFNINASFAVQSNRRGLIWLNEDDIGSCVEELWNRTILEDAVCKSYITMLTKMVTILPMDKYYLLWPSISLQMKHDQIISNKIYKTIADGEHLVLPYHNDAVCLKQAVFLDPKVKDHTEVGAIAMQALEYFGTELGYVVDLPKSLQIGFLNTGCEEKLVSRTLSAVDFFKSVVFTTVKNSYWSKEDLDNLLLHGLSEYGNDLSDMFISTPCIPTKPLGTRKIPSDLIHPHGDLAKLFLEDEECFPDQNFNGHDVLNTLVKLGMKKNELNWERLPERVSKAIEQSHSLVLRINYLIDYLLSRSTNSKDYVTERYKHCPDNIREKLLTMHFLPILKKGKEWQMPWKGDDYEESHLIAPRDGYHPDLRHLIGCVKLVVDASIFSSPRSKAILSWLGVKGKQSCLDAEIVLENMLTLSSHFMESGGTRTVMDRALEKSFVDMYTFLMRLIDKPNDLTNIKDSLTAQYVILHSKSLKTSDQMVLDLNANLTPYLFGVESSYKIFKDLFLKIGVHPTLSTSLLVRTLHAIYEDHQTEPLSSATVDCINIICMELQKMPMEGDIKDLYKDVKLPSEDNILTSIEKLYFDDCPWLGSDGGQDLIHLNKKFSHVVADHLGVKSKRTHDVDSKSSLFYSEFGQQEKLSNRIRRILEGYPCDESIMKEMLQNADDAGATEIIFIKDFRNLPKKCLPFDSLRDAQGPALCIYNDSAFTEKDIDGIQSLGKGSKFDKMLKTGQYGVGFNVVYHVTDFPSFWTRSDEVGENVCMFDPNRKYLRHNREQKPGIRMNVERFDKHYPDFMDGYLPKFTKDLKRGTLFRLPLRTEYMASTSEIRNEATHTKEVENLLRNLKREISSNLLFLDNIRTVKIGNVKSDGSLNVEHETTIRLNKKDSKKQEEYARYMRQLSRSLEIGELRLLQTPLEIRIIAHIESTQENHIQYVVVKRAGFLPLGAFKDTLCDALSRGTIKRLPRGGVALRSSNEEVVGLAYCMLPLPIETGLPVHVNGQFALDYESRHNICYSRDSFDGQWNHSLVKLLIVPAYISAIDFYKELVLLDGKKKYRNDELKKVVVKIEAKLPVVDKANGNFWKDLSKDVYRYIANEKIEFFPVLTESDNTWSDITWTAVKLKGNDNMLGFFNLLSTYFPDQLEESTSIYRSAGSVASQSLGTTTRNVTVKNILGRVLVELGMRIIQTSEIILKQFQISDCHVETVTPLNVLEFLKSFANAHVENRCVLGPLPSAIQDTVFKDTASLQLVLTFVLKDVTEENIEQLYGSPLLLRQDGILDVFDFNKRIIVSNYCDLIPEKSSEFVSSKVEPVLNEYVKSFNPLLHWSIDSFVFMLRSTKHNMCVGDIINWSDSKDNKRWIDRVWNFILTNCKDNQGLIDDSKLTPLKDVSLIPVRSGVNFELYPLSKRDRVLVMMQSTMKKFCDLMTKIGIPILLSIGPIELVVKTDCPSSVLSLLIKNCKFLRKISNDGASIIFTYFGKQQKEVENITQIRNLPIFETHDEKLIALNSETKYICLKDTTRRVPREGLEQWFNTSGIVILKYHECSQKILKDVGVDVVEPSDLYINYILTDCSGFNDENLLYHLIYIRDVLLRKVSIENEKLLINRLQNLQFLPRANGRRALASSFYNSSNNVFNIMKDHLEFPPAPFDAPEWKTFLLSAGLVCDISVQLFETLADTVSHLTISDETLEKSRTLVQHWLNAGEEFQTESSQRIKNIKFVERFNLALHSLNIQICDQFVDQRLVAFEGSYVRNLKNYTWTVANVLPWTVFSIQPKGLGLKIDVEPHVFLKNFKNVCHALENEARLESLDMSELTNMFESFYDYMQKHEQCINFSSLTHFNKILVPKEKKLVESSRVFLEPERDQIIRHYIYKAPVVFHTYFDIFQKLGVEQTPTPSVYTEVLKDIHDICDGKPLQPNESMIVSTCLQQLTQLWKSDPANNDDPSIPLYLPDHNTIMKKSSTLVFADNLFIRELVESMGLTYFIGFNELKVSIDDPLYQCKYWPKPYQMQLLSSLVEKRIDTKCLETAITDTLAQSTMFTLNHEDFHNSIIRLARHAQEDKRRHVFNQEEANAKIKKICEIKCMEVKTLRIEFFHNDTKINESETRDMVFVQREGPIADIVLYLDSSLEPDDHVYLVPALGQLMNEILNVSISDYFSALWSLAKKDLDEVSRFLDRKGIRASDFKSKNNTLLFPLPGTPIPENMHFLLDNNLCDFDGAEYVGLEIFDPSVQSEEIENKEYESDDSEFLELQNQLNESPMYIFAIIVEKISEGDETSFAKYKLKVGINEFIVMDSTGIYKILRQKKEFSKELVPIEDCDFEQVHDSVKKSPNVSSILREIRVMLTKAWRLQSECERRRVFKRLLLKWHPDKNPNDKETATHITQMIYHYIACLERDLPLEDSYEEQCNDTTDGASSRKSSYSGLFQEMNFRGSKYARHNYNERSGGRYTSHFNFHSFSEPNPMPGQAVRWLRQARYDLEAAELSLESNGNSHNWICYKCQQAAEKSMKAIWYSKDARQVSQSHNLVTISLGLSNDIQNLACNLQSRIGDHTRMRYPDTLQYPKVPFEVYDISHSSEACRLTREIITLSIRTIHG